MITHSQKKKTKPIMILASAHPNRKAVSSKEIQSRSQNHGHGVASLVDIITNQ